MSRERVVDAVAEAVLALRRNGPVRVAIDGPDAAGKTMLADELRDLVEAAGRSAVRVSIDGFLRPRRKRAEGDAQSAVGYYHEAFDAEAFNELVLAPLRADGDRVIRMASYDYQADSRTIGDAETERRYRERYLPAQLLYRNEVAPIVRAHVLIDNEDPVRPVLLRCEAP